MRPVLPDTAQFLGADSTVLSPAQRETIRLFVWRMQANFCMDANGLRIYAERAWWGTLFYLVPA